MKNTSPYSATSKSHAAKQIRSAAGCNAAKPLCEVNRCVEHTAVPLQDLKQNKAESVVQKLTMCMDGRHEISAKLELLSSAK